MGDIERLVDNNTKSELRLRVNRHGFSIPRGSTKADIARMLAQFESSMPLIRKCPDCGKGMYETDDGSYECNGCGRRTTCLSVVGP